MRARLSARMSVGDEDKIEREDVRGEEDKIERGG